MSHRSRRLQNSSLPACGSIRLSPVRRKQFFLLILIAAALLRLPGLDQAPPPLHWDEASRCYDAWSILSTGADRHGQRWPLFLRSFGDGDWTAALTTYLTVPWIACLGPGAWAVRLPDALLGILSVAALYVLLRRMVSPGAALFGAAMLALDPWHIALCRTGQEAGFAPFFLILGLLGIQRSGLLEESSDVAPDTDSTRRTEPAWAALAGLMFAMHAWVYPAARLFTPLFLIAMFFIYRSVWISQWRSHHGRRTMLAGAIGMAIGAAPLVLTAITHPERLAARSRVTILAANGLSTSVAIGEFARNYAANLSPSYLFIRSDEMSGMTIDGAGLHLLAAAPMVLVGLAVSIACARSSRWHQLLIAWLLLYPIPAAICRDWNPHPFRTVAGMALFPILCAVGWNWLQRHAANRPAPALRHALAGMILLILANAAWFADVYFRRMPARLEVGYQTAMVRAMQFAGERLDDVDFVLVTRWVNQPYVYALLYAPIPPNELHGLEKLEGDDMLGFHQVNRVGKFFFPPRGPEKTPELTAKFQQAFNSIPPNGVGLVIELAGRFGGGEVLATFRNGREAGEHPPLEVRRWRRSEDPRPRTSAGPAN